MWICSESGSLVNLDRCYSLGVIRMMKESETFLLIADYNDSQYYHVIARGTQDAMNKAREDIAEQLHMIGFGL